MNRPTESFVRFPTALFDRLLRIPLNGTQWRIVLWVIRHTFGWHEASCEFSWYKVAKDLSMDRGGVVRAAARLLRAGILTTEGRNISAGEDNCHRKTMTKDIPCADKFHRERCLESTVFHRAKDSCKETKKRKIKITPTHGDDFPISLETNKTAHQHLTEPLKGRGGKYERLSQN